MPSGATFVASWSVADAQQGVGIVALLGPGQPVCGDAFAGDDFGPALRLPNVAIPTRRFTDDRAQLQLASLVHRAIGRIG